MKSTEGMVKIRVLCRAKYANSSHSKLLERKRRAEKIVKDSNKMKNKVLQKNSDCFR